MPSPLPHPARAAIVLAGTWSGAAWLLFGAATFPWIVPADGDAASDTLLERLSAAGRARALLSLGTTALAGGWLGTGAAARRTAVAGLPVQRLPPGAGATPAWRLAHGLLVAGVAALACFPSPAGRSSARGDALRRSGARPRSQRRSDPLA